MNKKSLEAKITDIEYKLTIIETLTNQINAIADSFEDYYNCDFTSDKDIVDRVVDISKRFKKVSEIIGG